MTRRRNPKPRLRIAVYAIAKNEAKHVTRFMESARAADVVVVTDTGSSDGTPELLRQAGAQVHLHPVGPFRFDVARNAALANVPGDVDVCVSVDLDEVLSPGWRDEIERAWKPYHGGLVVALVSSTGQGGALRVHARRGWQWQDPVHEQLVPDTLPAIRAWVANEPKSHCPRIEIHHHPDAGKSRAFYVDLMEEMAAKEPDRESWAGYLARHYYAAGDYAKAVAVVRRLTDRFPIVDRCSGSVALEYQAAALHRLGRFEEALQSYAAAYELAPERPECLLRMAVAMIDAGRRDEAQRAAKQAAGLSLKGLAPHLAEQVRMSCRAVMDYLASDVTAPHDFLRLLPRVAHYESA